MDWNQWVTFVTDVMEPSSQKYWGQSLVLSQLTQIYLIVFNFFFLLNFKILWTKTADCVQVSSIRGCKSFFLSSLPLYHGEVSAYGWRQVTTPNESPAHPRARCGTLLKGTSAVLCHCPGNLPVLPEPLQTFGYSGDRTRTLCFSGPRTEL